MQRLVISFMVLILWLIGGAVAAEEGKALQVIPGPRQANADFGPWNDPMVARIGYRLPQAIEEWGPPMELSVNRGNETWQDSVIFYYADHSYLYWWGNRLWQIRFDTRYKGEVLGVEMGLQRQEVLKRLGKPFNASPTDLIYQLPDRGFPLRLRLIFSNELLTDLYLYRSDF